MPNKTHEALTSLFTPEHWLKQALAPTAVAARNRMDDEGSIMQLGTKSHQRAIMEQYSHDQLPTNFAPDYAHYGTPHAASPELSAWNGQYGDVDPNLINDALAAGTLQGGAQIAGLGASSLLGQMGVGAAMTTMPGDSSPLTGALSTAALMHPIRTAAALAPAVAAAYSPEAEAAGGDLVTRFFRGIPRLAKANLSDISGLKELRREFGHSPAKLNTQGNVWATDNPLVASSYAGQGGAIVPLDLLTPPDVTLDARGMPWNRFYFNGSKNYPEQPNLNHLRKGEFKDAIEDPAVRNILVKNILDPGPDMYRYMDFYKTGMPEWQQEHMGANLLESGDHSFHGNNLLIKDPTSVNYGITGEPANFAGGGAVEPSYPASQEPSYNSSTWPFFKEAV